MMSRLQFSRLISRSSRVLIELTHERASSPGARNFSAHVTKEEMTEMMNSMMNSINSSINSLRGELNQVRADLRGELNQVRADLRGELNQVRADLQGELNQVRADVEKHMARTRADVEVWGTPLIHIAAGDIVLFLMGPPQERQESLSLEGGNPFRFTGIVYAALRCNIDFDQFRRACDRSRVDRNLAAHALDIEHLAVRVDAAQEIFERYPYMAKKMPHQYLLISNFNTIKICLQELYAAGNRHHDRPEMH